MIALAYILLGYVVAFAVMSKNLSGFEAIYYWLGPMRFYSIPALLVLGFLLRHLTYFLLRRRTLNGVRDAILLKVVSILGYKLVIMTHETVADDRNPKRRLRLSRINLASEP